MPAVIRVSAVYTMSDQVSSKLAKMASRVTALEKSLDRANTQIDLLGDRAKSAIKPLGDVNKQLTDMKKTLGTSKGSSGLIYRVDQLNKRLKTLSGGRGGHQIKVSTRGVKQSEREILGLHAKAAALTSGEYKIKLTVDRNTTELLKEQAAALDRVGGSIKEVTSGFSALKKGEAELRSTMRAKTQAASKQRQVLAEVQRQMKRNTRETQMFKRAARDGGLEARRLTDHLLDLHRAGLQSGTAFVRGVKMGFPFSRLLPLIAVGANLAAVAIGGLLVTLHGLIAPTLSVISSLKDMVGVVGLIPAAYAAAGAAVLSFTGAMKAYFGDALTNAGKLNEIQKKLDTVKDAEERKTLLEQQSKLLGEMTAEQQGLAKSAADLMKQWRELFTSNTKLQARFFRTAHYGITVAGKLIKRYGGEIQATADSVRMLAFEFLKTVRTNKDLDAGLRAMFRTARTLVGALKAAVDPLMTFFGRVLVAAERPLERIALAFQTWAESLQQIPVAKIEAFFTKGLDSASQWWRILKNIGGAFSNIFRAGEGETQKFLDTLEEVTAQFKEWTGGEGFAVIQREFKNGMKVARALGRFVKEFVHQFMLLGADGKVGKSVVDFIDTLTGGLPGLFKFFSSALRTVGPSITEFIKSLPSMTEIFDSIGPALALTLDVLSEFNRVLGYLIENIPGMKTLLGVILSYKAAAFVFGGAFGQIFGVLSSGHGSLLATIDGFKRLKGAMKGAAGASAVATAASAPGVWSTPVPAGRGRGAARAGVDVSSRGAGRGGAGGAAAAAAGAASFLPIPGKAGKNGGQAVGKGLKMAQGAAKIPVLGRVLAPLISALAGLGSALAPITAIVLAVVAAFTALFTNFAGIRDEMVGFASDMKTRFVDTFSKLTQELGLGAIGSEKFVNTLKDVWMFFQSIGVAIVKMVKVPLAWTLNTFLFVIDAVVAVVKAIKQWWSGVSQIIDGIRTLDFGKIWNGIKTLFTTLPTLLFNLLKGALSRFGDFLGDAFGTFGKKVVATFQWVGDHIHAAFAGIVNSIIDMVNKIPRVDIDNVEGPGKVQGLGSRYDAIDTEAARNEAMRTSPPAGQPGSILQGPAAPGKAPKAPPTNKATKAADRTLTQAATGKSARGVVVAFDPASVSSFNKTADGVQKTMKKTQMPPFFVSRPLKVAMDNGIKILKSTGAVMAAEMDSVGAKVTASVQKWAAEVEKALGTLASGSAAASSGTTGGGGGASSTSSPTPMAGGGFVVPGDSRRPDSVHALLKPGEVVLNEGQQQKLGKALVNKSLVGPGTAAKGTFGYNMMDAPSSAMRFAGGGSVWGNVPPANPNLIPFIQAASKFGLYPTSTTNHSKYTSSGNISDHSLGNAVDLAGGNMAGFQRSLMPSASSIKQLLGPTGLYNYGKAFADAALQAQHNNHVHIGIGGGAMSLAGIGEPAKVPKAPDLGNSGFGTAAGKRVNSMIPGLQARLDAAMLGGDYGSFAAAGSAQQIGQAMASSVYNWGGSEWGSLQELWRRESNWNPTAENKSSGAYGIPQALPPTKMPPAAQKSGGSDPAAQIGWGLNYIKGRYGSPSAALAHHDRMNWYGGGGEGIATSPTTIGVGDKREHVQITPSRTEAKPGGAIQSNASQGPSRGHITNNFYIGVLTGDEKHLRQLAGMVGEVIADQVEAAASSSVADSSEIMSGNG